MSVIKKLADNLDGKYNQLVGNEGLKTDVSLDIPNETLYKLGGIILFTAITFVGGALILKNSK